MATANASSARSWNLGGIMTLSSPIKSSRARWWSVHVLRRRRWNTHTHASGAHKAVERPCMALSSRRWNPQLKCDVFMLRRIISFTYLLNKYPRVYLRRLNRLRSCPSWTRGQRQETAAAVTFVPHEATFCPSEELLTSPARHRRLYYYPHTIGRTVSHPCSRGFLLVNMGSTITVFSNLIGQFSHSRLDSARRCRNCVTCKSGQRRRRLL